MLAGRAACIVTGMTRDFLPTRHASFRTFLAERYRAGTSHAVARSESQAAQGAAIELSAEGRSVTLIGSLLVPGDETIFLLFGAASPENVAAVGERINQPYDRVSEAVPMTPPRDRNVEEA